MDKAGFLENLTNARKSRGLTQKEVAEAVGVSDKAYSKWETGENEPDIDALCRLGAYYGPGPALFFREGEEPSLLEGQDIEAAAETCFRRICDLLLSLRSVRYPAPGEEKELPPPEMPPELRMPDSEGSIWHYAYRDLVALIAAGTDANFALVMLPHRERYRWLRSEGEGLEALFRVLGMPGAVRCLSAMLTEIRGGIFTPAYLAEKAGVTAEEAGAFLAAAEPYGICHDAFYYRSERADTVYSSRITAQLTGILTLGRIVLSGDYRREERRGTIVSGSGSVNLSIPKEEEP